MPPKPAAKKVAKKPAAKVGTTGTAASKSKPSTSAAPSKKVVGKSSGKPTAEKDVTDKMAKLSTEEKSSPQPTAIEVAFKDLASVLKDEDGKIKATGKWPLLVDATGRTAVFFRYQGGNFLDTQNPSEMKPDSIRRQLLGSLRYAKYFIIDFADSDMFEPCGLKFDDVNKGLLDDVMDKSILEKFPYLIRDSDGPDYEEDKFMPHVTAEFMCIVLSKIEPSPQLAANFCVIKVQVD